MIVKFFTNKQGGGISSIDYLLDKRREQGTARILQGDEKTTRNLILSLKQKHKACVGCLSFEEANIDEEAKKEIMESFEYALLTDEMKYRYNILWIEHTDKGRLELNFVIPKVDLETHKAFNPYYHAIDMPRKDKWTDITNLKYGLTDPKDPSKQNSLEGSKKQINLIKDYEDLDNLLRQMVEAGQITSREKLINLLKENNIEVTRQGKDYISVKLPGSKKARRFKGGFYEEFRSIEELEGICAEGSRRKQAFDQRNDRETLTRLERELDSLIESKARFYREQHARQNERVQSKGGRFRSGDAKQHAGEYQETSSPKKQDPSNNIFVRNDNSNDFKLDCMDSVDKALSSIEGTCTSDQFRGDLSNNAEERASGGQRWSSPTNKIEEDNDYIRSLTYERNRKIAEQDRELAGRSKELTERSRKLTDAGSRAIERARKFAEWIQSKFREYREILERRRKLKQEQLAKQKRIEQTRIKPISKNKGFSR